MVVIDYNHLVTKEQFQGIHTKLQNSLQDLGVLQPLVFSAEGVRQMLEEREERFRAFFAPYGVFPPLSYTLTVRENGFLVTVHRSINLEGYADFASRFFLDSVHSLGGLTDFLDSIYLLLAQESLQFQALFVVNSFYNSLTQEVSTPYTVSFVPDTFYKKQVEFISDNELRLVANFESTLEFAENLLQGLDVNNLKRDELGSLSTAQSTLELLSKKSPLISYLLDVGRLGLVKLLKPTFDRTWKQFQSYPKITGYAYYLEDGVFGVIHRTEYGTSVVLSPRDIHTFAPVEIDLLGDLT